MNHDNEYHETINYGNQFPSGWYFNKITDGDIKRASQKYTNLQAQKVKKIMTKNPLGVYKDTLVSKALSIMTDKKKITSLCVNSKPKRTIGIIHIHNILQSNIT